MTSGSYPRRNPTNLLLQQTCQSVVKDFMSLYHENECGVV